MWILQNKYAKPTNRPQRNEIKGHHFSLNLYHIGNLKNRSKFWLQKLQFKLYFLRILMRKNKEICELYGKMESKNL